MRLRLTGSSTTSGVSGAAMGDEVATSITTVVCNVEHYTAVQTRMAFNFFRRQPNERERAVADRLPPGQYPTEKWPVLHYGGVPRVDIATWDFTSDGLADAPVTLTYDQLQALPSRDVHAAVHCVTRWSRLDSNWQG